MPYFNFFHWKMSCCLMPQSIGAELEQDRYKGVEIRGLNFEFLQSICVTVFPLLNALAFIQF